MLYVMYADKTDGRSGIETKNPTETEEYPR